MATLDKIVLRIEGDLADINKKLQSMEKNVSRSTQKSANAFKNMARLGKIAIAGLVATGLTRMVGKMIDLAAGAEEMNNKFQVVFGELAGTVKSQLDSFGNTVGRSTEELQAMASSVQDTFVPLGFAREEAAKLSVALTKLSVDVGSFNDMNDPEVMKAFQSALVGNHETVRRFGIVIDQARLEQELFEMGITENIRTVDAATKVQARFNIIMKGTEDAHGDATNTASSYANTTKRLNAEVTELAIGMGNALTPALAFVKGAMADVVEQFKNFLILQKIIATDNVSTNIRILATEIDELEEKQDSYKESIDLLNESIAEGVVVSDRQRKKTERDIQQLKREKKAIDDKIESRTQEVMLLLDKTSLADRLNKVLETQESKEKKLSKTTRDARQELQDAIDDINAQIDIYEDGLAGVDEEQIKVALSMTKFSEAIALAGEQGTAFQQILQAKLVQLNRTKEEYDKLTKAQEKTGESTKRLDALTQSFLDVTVSMGDALEDNFIETIKGTKNALDGFKDMSRQLVEEILRIYMRMSIINPIIRSIFGDQQGFDASQFPVADPSAILKKGRNLLTGRASGGPVKAGQPYMVGERGPEMFVPNQSGNIIPNGASGTVVNQSLNFSTGVVNTVRAEVMNMLPIIQNATLEAVVDQKRRGGSFAQGLS